LLRLAPFLLPLAPFLLPLALETEAEAAAVGVRHVTGMGLGSAIVGVTAVFLVVILEDVAAAGGLGTAGQAGSRVCRGL